MMLGPKHARSLLLLLAALAIAGACREDTPTAGDPPAKSAAAPVEGAMCAEHGVLEAICTKCNPKLIPVFQAKGDWCEEHGFPESICPICHPERGGKPAVDVAADKAPSDGTKVRFAKPDTAAVAGIETVPAEQRPGGARITAIVRIAYDATRRAEVNARSPGVVAALAVDVGTTVKRGARLGVIESATVGADRSREVAALARVKLAETTLQRERELEASEISARKDVLAAEQDLAEARAELAATRAALGVVGGGGSGGGASGSGRYVVTAPLAGVVTQRNATIGRMVDLEDLLFEIVDTSVVWAELDVPEADLALVAPGQTVEMSIDGLPDRAFSGTVGYVAPEIDPRSRTARARVSLPNSDGVLRVNMFGSASIAVGARRETVMVPRAAVQRAGEVDLVFVRTGPAEFETRRVKVGVAEADAVEIVDGIKVGEPVATQGSFLLKTETLKGSIGAGCCEED